MLDRQLTAHRPPDALLLLGVVDVGDRLTRSPVERERGDVIAPSAVIGVGEARMILGQVHGDLTVGAGRDGRIELCFLEHLPSCESVVHSPRLPGVRQTRRLARKYSCSMIRCSDRQYNHYPLRKKVR